jgi:hypothetical protein
VRLFGLRDQEKKGRSAEDRGDFAQAAALYAEAGLLEEAARVTILRGDAETRPNARLRHYARAATLAPESSPWRARALTKRALAVVVLASNGPVTAVARRDLGMAARELEALGEHELAADAYGRAGDRGAQLRALERAGSIESIELLLDAENDRERAVRARRSQNDEFAFLVAGGRRREALALAYASDDPGLRQRGDAITSRRLWGTHAHVSVRGRRMHLLLGDELVIGRAPDVAPHEDFRPPSRRAALVLGAPSLSRSHLSIFRRDGAVFVRDLESRHGTTLRGFALGEVAMGEGIKLVLGGAVAVALRPAMVLEGAVEVTVDSACYIAPLGPASLGVGRWRIERAADDWLEIVTDGEPPAYSGGLEWPPRATLLAGDAIATERGGTCEVEVGGGRPDDRPR